MSRFFFCIYLFVFKKYILYPTISHTFYAQRNRMKKKNKFFIFFVLIYLTSIKLLRLNYNIFIDFLLFFVFFYFLYLMCVCRRFLFKYFFIDFKFKKRNIFHGCFFKFGNEIFFLVSIKIFKAYKHFFFFCIALEKNKSIYFSIFQN